MGRKSTAQRRALSHQRDQSCFQQPRALVEAARHSPARRGAPASHVLVAVRAVHAGAAIGRGGQWGHHLLEVDESLVGAESRCQRTDPGVTDGIALQTDTDRGRR